MVEVERCLNLVLTPHRRYLISLLRLAMVSSFKFVLQVTFPFTLLYYFSRCVQTYGMGMRIQFSYVPKPLFIPLVYRIRVSGALLVVLGVIFWGSGSHPVHSQLSLIASQINPLKGHEPMNTTQIPLEPASTVAGLSFEICVVGSEGHGVSYKVDNWVSFLSFFGYSSTVCMCVGLAMAHSK